MNFTAIFELMNEFVVDFLVQTDERLATQWSEYVEDADLKSELLALMSRKGSKAVRPKTPLALFTAAQIHKRKTENKPCKGKEVREEISAEWKTLENENKKKWYDEANKRVDEMNEGVEEEKRVKHFVLKESKKKVATAFGEFKRLNKDDVADLPAREANARLKFMWEEIDFRSEERVHYENLARAANGLPPVDPPHRTAMALFCIEQRPLLRREHADLKNSDITKKLSQMWKDLDKTEKRRYADSADPPKQKQKNTYSTDEIAEMAFNLYFIRHTPDICDRYDVESLDEIPNLEEVKEHLRTNFNSDRGRVGKYIEKVKRKIVEESQKKKPAKDKDFEKFVAANIAGIQELHPEFTTRKIRADLKKTWQQMSEEEKTEFL